MPSLRSLFKSRGPQEKSQWDMYCLIRGRKGSISRTWKILLAVQTQWASHMGRGCQKDDFWWQQVCRRWEYRTPRRSLTYSLFSFSQESTLPGNNGSLRQQNIFGPETDVQNVTFQTPVLIKLGIKWSPPTILVIEWDPWTETIRDNQGSPSWS